MIQRHLALLLIRVGFRPTVKQVMSIAGGESKIFRHNFIGSEHLLCALFSLPNSPLGFHPTLQAKEIKSVRRGVVRVDRLGPKGRIVGFRAMTPRLKKILTIAESERLRLKYLTIPQSLLLGILIEGRGVAVRVLKRLKYDNEQMRKELETPNKLSDPTSPSVTPPAGAGGAPSVTADH